MRRETVKQEHLWFVAGVIVGYMVVPYVIGMIRARKG